MHATPFETSARGHPPNVGLAQLILQSCPAPSLRFFKDEALRPSATFNLPVHALASLGHCPP
eukprot:12934494-Prorocentrum_lima.AAC.1